MANKIDEGISKLLQMGYSELENREEIEKLEQELSELEVNKQIEYMRFLIMYKPDDPVLSNFERFKESLRKSEKS